MKNVFNIKHQIPEFIKTFIFDELLNNVEYEPDSYTMYINLFNNYSIFNPLLELKNNKLRLYV